jgi:hypothetical protein
MNIRNEKNGNDKLFDKKYKFWHNEWINFSLRYIPFMYRGAVTVSISKICRKAN